MGIVNFCFGNLFYIGVFSVLVSVNERKYLVRDAVTFGLFGNLL